VSVPQENRSGPYGRYLLRELLARGGMGEVFRAIAVGADGFEKPVVVKRILPTLDDKAVEMFAKEAKAMSRLAHPNIVQVIDYGRGEHGETFLVMELIDGVDVHGFRRAYAKRGEAVPVALAVFVMTQTLRALEHAHAKEYVHRDVSPGNILLSRLGEVKLGDFGVALMGEGLESDVIVGKPSYMAPEQWRGDPLDRRADLFAAGVVLFYLLTGELPFDGADASERQVEAAAGRMRELSVLRADAGEALEALLRQALAAAPGDRFASARAMRRALESASTLPSSDDLAEAVERALSDMPADAQPVLSLGLGNKRETFLGELTRVDESGTFTIQPSAVAPTIQRAPRRWPLYLAAVFAAGAATFVWQQRAPRASLSQGLPAFEPSVPTVEQPRSAAPPSISAPLASHPASIPHVPSISAAPSAVPCIGEVLLAAKGSWWVDGGPKRVQAPGRYNDWPCGSYTLTGTSRQDGQQLTRQVVVREGVLGSARFE